MAKIDHLTIDVAKITFVLSFNPSVEIIINNANITTESVLIIHNIASLFGTFSPKIPSITLDKSNGEIEDKIGLCINWFHPIKKIKFLKKLFFVLVEVFCFELYSIE
ncbi:Uncharacterised protein [Mycoplasmopsis edwardii]|uniref:Uncharacterized protein n=1 Tax=Mycoplasmopsis edwardii TaxID=53558 RepID=A0A3B0Q9P5_9BACT|nr:Uncharacterised protein [Mycoplasmopsis edwardii]